MCGAPAENDLGITDGTDDEPVLYEHRNSRCRACRHATDRRCLRGAGMDGSGRTIHPIPLVRKFEESLLGRAEALSQGLLRVLRRCGMAGCGVRVDACRWLQPTEPANNDAESCWMPDKSRAFSTRGWATRLSYRLSLTYSAASRPACPSKTPKNERLGSSAIHKQCPHAGMHVRIVGGSEPGPASEVPSGR